MADITYCRNRLCPFEDCIRHVLKAEKAIHERPISVANFDGVCERYIAFLADETEMEDEE